jgi:hypothetical protein
MKKTLLAITLIIGMFGNLNCQDILYKNDGTEIKAKVIEITDSFIKYKNFNQLDGPLRNLDVGELFMIIYQDGTKEIFKKPDNTNQQKTVNTNNNNGVNANNPTINNTNNDISNTNPPKTTESKYFKYRKNIYGSISIGYGNSYGGFGLRLQGRFGRLLGFGIHGGIGYFPFNGGGVLASGGLKFFFYKGMYINAQYGLVGVETHQNYSNYNGHSSYSYSKYTLQGLSFLFGGDWIFGRHVGLNAALGYSKVFNSLLMGSTIALDFGLIIKF